MSSGPGVDKPRRENDPNRKVGREYIYQPTGMDAWDPKPFHPAPGSPVRITSGPGVGRVKKPFAYVEHAETGEFHGMVNRASLKPRGK
jgi:hypothetical protein